jgi:PIN domain nuclease of toxin-antitoxin system
MSTSSDGYRLDSHVLLWWWFNLDRLSEVARLPLLDPTTTIRVSAATVWELCLMHNQGKLPELANVIQDLPSLLQADGFKLLPTSIAHGLRAGGFSQTHRDPSGRMLAAQAELERLVLITADEQFANFPCPIL